MGRMVIAAYQPKPGKNEELLELAKEHIPILRNLGLVTDRTPIAMITPTGVIVEVFEWVSDEAIQQAHTNPAVLAMWERYGAACDYVPYGSLPEAAELFPGFEPLDF